MLPLTLMLQCMFMLSHFIFLLITSSILDCFVYFFFFILSFWPLLFFFRIFVRDVYDVGFVPTSTYFFFSFLPSLSFFRFFLSSISFFCQILSFFFHFEPFFDVTICDWMPYLLSALNCHHKNSCTL